MEMALREAKARLSELVTAACRGERVVITKYGRPAVELVRCEQRGGIDFDKLEEDRRRLGLVNAPPEGSRGHGGCAKRSALSLKVLGFEDEERG